MASLYNLLYKYSSNATSKYWGIPEDTWKKIVNTQFKKGECDGKHAKLIMIEDLENIQDYLTIQPDDYEESYKAILSVEVISSYSPCYPCAQALCKVKKKQDEKVKQIKTRNKDPGTVREDFSALSSTTEIEAEETIKLKITFSTFYKHLEYFISGLRENMVAAGLHVAPETPEESERRQRERDDWKILQYLEGLVTLERMHAAVQTMEEDLRKINYFNQLK
ncbi:unnamed protein product [Mytilus edulis]|uniref:Uncharacterized protein n=1 Tax=Mytilus edulis TaxID=6550 RepID=A0A8S3UE28_MYTED|nr:unnamed protein product [Mytilus edulis]